MKKQNRLSESYHFLAGLFWAYVWLMLFFLMMLLIIPHVIVWLVSGYSILGKIDDLQDKCIDKQLDHEDF